MLPHELTGRRRRPWPPAGTATTKCCRSCWRATAGPDCSGSGITALIAGFMSGMAGNVSAFATVWTYDIYRALFMKDATDEHYVRDGPLVHDSRRADQHRHRVSGDAVLEHHGLRAGAVQLLHRAAVRHGAAGMLWKRATPAGGFWGLLCGTLSSIGMWAWVKAGSARSLHRALPNAKDMAENMYRALWSWTVCVIVTVGVSLVTKPMPDRAIEGPGLRLHGIPERRPPAAFTSGPCSGPRGRGGLRDHADCLLVRLSRELRLVGGGCVPV